MNDCLFCKIIVGDIPSDKIYETEHVVCFLDIKPINPGHALIVPKHHHKDIHDTPPDTLAHMIRAAQVVARALVQNGADGINLGMNNGSAAGQVIWHAHLHVIPRSSSDGLKTWPHKTTSAEDLSATAAALTRHLNGNL